MTGRTVTAAEAQGPYRVGSHYGIHVYQGDRPVATFHDAEEAARVVAAANDAARLAGEVERLTREREAAFGVDADDGHKCVRVEAYLALRRERDAANARADAAEAKVRAVEASVRFPIPTGHELASRIRAALADPEARS